MGTLPPPIHNILFTIPRTASNLVTRILDLPNQPSISRHPRDGYFFQAALGYRYEHDTFGRPVEDWNKDEREGMQFSLQTSFNEWEKWVQGAELKGKGTFIKEHINWMIRSEVESNFLYGAKKGMVGYTGNPTCIPDTFFNKTRPTFLIRHPAFVVPSLVRTALDNEGIDALITMSTEKIMRWEATYYWHVALYKFYVNQSMAYPCPSHEPNVTYPIVLDAADLSDNALVQRYAAAVGLNPKIVQFEWDATGEEGLGKVEARMMDTLLKSRGVLRERLEKGRDLDLEMKKEEWMAEFGEELGGRVADLVEGAMADYKWLWQRRMRT
jgi:hypothetical protein